MNSHGKGNLFNSSTRKNQSPVSVIPSNQSKTNPKKTNPLRPLSSSTRIITPHNRDTAQVEEEINITVPTPYPRAQFMTIDDPVLHNSDYTNALNEKYPPRQYLKHNQQSWNKIAKPKSSDIKFSFMNPVLSFSDFNLKKITFKNEEIGKGKLTNLEEAQELVDTLKAKLIEYELTNNTNITQANEMIGKYKDIIEEYKAKLNDLYEKIGQIEQKYEIDILDDGNPYAPIAKGFRRRRLIKSFMNAFVNRITRQKIIKHQYNQNRKKKNVILKLKAFISLEKFNTMGAFAKTLLKKKTMTTIKNAFNCLHHNKYLNRIKQQFGLIQSHMGQLLYLKELKLRIAKKKNYQSKNCKALLFYYRKGVNKAIRALNKNVIRKSANLASSSKVNYSKFASSLGKIDKRDKENKIKGMNVMKSLMDQITEVNTKKMSQANNNTVIIMHYFREWKRGAKENKLISEYSKVVKQHMIKSFFQAVFKTHRLFHPFSSLSESTKVRKAHVKHFFSLIKRDLLFKSKCIEVNQKLPLIIKRSFIGKLQGFLVDNPKIHFRRIQKKLLYGDFIDSLRNNVKYIKSVNKLSLSEALFNRQLPVLYFKLFFLGAKTNILTVNRKSKRIKALVAKSLLSKSLHALLIKAYNNKQISLRSYYENTIFNIKTIITEKSGMINQLEYDNKDLAVQLDEGQAAIKTISSENKLLRQSLYEQQYNYENELRQYRELLEQNANDAKSLQLTIRNNESLLSEAIEREEQLQHKYVSDVQNIVKLNKNLNEIITKKNQQLFEANIIKRKEAEEEHKEKIKRNQQQTDLYNNLTYTMKQKEYENKQLEQERNKKIYQSSVLLEHYQKEKQIVDYQNSQLLRENKMLLSKIQPQASI